MLVSLFVYFIYLFILDTSCRCVTTLGHAHLLAPPPYKRRFLDDFISCIWAILVGFPCHCLHVTLIYCCLSPHFIRFRRVLFSHLLDFHVSYGNQTLVSQLPLYVLPLCTQRRRHVSILNLWHCSFSDLVFDLGLIQSHIVNYECVVWS